MTIKIKISKKLYDTFNQSMLLNNITQVFEEHNLLTNKTNYFLVGYLDENSCFSQETYITLKNNLDEISFTKKNKELFMKSLYLAEDFYNKYVGLDNNLIGCKEFFISNLEKKELSKKVKTKKNTIKKERFKV